MDATDPYHKVMINPGRKKNSSQRHLKLSKTAYSLGSSFESPRPRPSFPTYAPLILSRHFAVLPACLFSHVTGHASCTIVSVSKYAYGKPLTRYLKDVGLFLSFNFRILQAFQIPIESYSCLKYECFYFCFHLTKPYLQKYFSPSQISNNGGTFRH